MYWLKSRAWSAVSFFEVPVIKFQKRDINSASESAFLGSFGDFFIPELPQKRRCFNKQEFTRIHSLLVNCCCLSVQTRALTCPFKPSNLNLSAWSLLSWHPTHTPHTYTSEWDSLFLQNCLLSTVLVTLSDLYYVNGCFSWTVSMNSHEHNHGYDSLYSYDGVYAHPAVAVWNHWRLWNMVSWRSG